MNTALHTGEMIVLDRRTFDKAACSQSNARGSASLTERSPIATVYRRRSYSMPEELPCSKPVSKTKGVLCVQWKIR